MTGRPTELGRSFFPQMLTAGALAHGWRLHYSHFGLRTIFVRTGFMGGCGAVFLAVLRIKIICGCRGAFWPGQIFGQV